MDEIRQIARAVLYEGYLLWPYRESALKNRHRWTIGGVHPGWYDGGRCRMRTQCLVEAGPDDTVEVCVRFLHVVARGRGEEAREREVSARVLTLGGGSVRTEIDLTAGEEREGEVPHRWEALRGHVEVAAEPLGPGLFRITADLVNTTPEPAPDTRAPDTQAPGTRDLGTGDVGTRDLGTRDQARARVEALARTFVSAHAVLHVPRGRFVSLMDPPEHLREHAAGCRNDGAWPVLVGADLRTMLASPIILYDHPRIAQESPGDLFDATEIDQLLTLSVLALSDGERAEIRDGDPRAREILDRCTALTEEQLMRLHGIMRKTEPTP
ncbi:hypothetical protein GCM10022224_035160 [Nonomuraea antimicrobica]|uniref:Hydrogenase maturation protease n=1 Tax=Nonomuraea antimicrobica TaxID=561173 RepID=A0ABP7BT26_9ACTN